MEEPKIKFADDKKGLLTGVLLILVSLGIYSFALNPFAAKISDVKDEVEAKEIAVEDLKADIAELMQAEKDLDLSTEVQKLEIFNSIPVGINQDDVIRDLLAIAEDHDVELNSISFGKGSAGAERIGSLRINSSFEGNYTDLIGFLQGIEQNARLFKVTAINVQLEELSISTVTRANFTLTMEAFYQEDLNQ